MEAAELVAEVTLAGTSKSWIEIVALIGPIIIAAVVAGFVWQQNRISRGQLRLALFDRRYRVFDGLWDLIGATIRYKDANEYHVVLKEFSASTYGNVFLFDTDIKEYLAEVRKKAAEFSGISQTLADLSPSNGNKKRALMKERADLWDWFSAQYKASSEKFGKYMRFKT